MIDAFVDDKKNSDEFILTFLSMVPIVVPGVSYDIICVTPFNRRVEVFIVRSFELILRDEKFEPIVVPLLSP